jgi:hypothetical protein
MPTRASEKRGVGPAVKDVAEHASTLARLELELAGLEVKRKVAALGIGLGLVLGAGVLALFALGFGLAAGAVALALVVSTWLALLMVFGALLVLAAILGLVGLSAMRSATPPVPEQAVHEAKLTTEAIRGDGAH